MSRHRPAGLLSHGDQRLLEVAMALAQQPRLLLLDEPTQGLSVEETAQAVDTLAGTAVRGAMTVLLVEHDMEVVFRLAAHDHRAASRRGDRRRLAGRGARRMPRCSVRISEVSPDADDRRASTRTMARATCCRASIWSCRRAASVAVLGRNGVGKTTTLRTVMGLVPPSGGRVLLDGTDITGWPPHRVARAGVAYVPEGRLIFPDLTVVENIRVAERRRRGRGRYRG